MYVLFLSLYPFIYFSFTFALLPYIFPPHRDSHDFKHGQNNMKI